MNMNNFATLQTRLHTEERNRKIIRRQIELWESGDLDAIAAFFAEDCFNHGEPAGRAVIREVIDDIWTTFPDWRARVTAIAAEGDDVVVLLEVSGTHLGVGRLPVNGGLLVGVSPTGLAFTAQHIHWYRLRGDEIIDHHATRDDLGMMQQLGLLPAPAAFSIV
jgi:predicted ester cyclase